MRARHGILLTLAYDGARFSGFAPQNNGVTVAGVLRAAIQQMDPSVGALRVASRTDAGVHARAQVVCFDTQLDIESRGWPHVRSRRSDPFAGSRRAAPRLR